MLTSNLLSRLHGSCRRAGRCDAAKYAAGRVQAHKTLNALVSLCDGKMVRVECVCDVPSSIIVYIGVDKDGSHIASIARSFGDTYIPCSTMAFQGFAYVADTMGYPCLLTIDMCDNGDNA